MNRKGFTLVELIATIVVLGIVMSIVLVSVNVGFGEAKDKTEDVFVDTIKDAMKMYLDGDKKDSSGNALSFSKCTNLITKSRGTGEGSEYEVNVYKAETKFDAVIKSKYEPITQNDLVNPANKVKCAIASDIDINIYRDEDFVYYYSIDKNSFECLTQSGKISNLPEGFDC